MTTSEHINEIAKACAAAQKALRPAVKDATNPAFKSKYADIAAVVEAAKVYADQGVAIFQEAASNEIGVAVTTRLVHQSGQWIEFGPLTVPTMKKDAHGVGSATTYAKRYALSAALLIASDEDDDGNGAVAKPSRAGEVVKVPEGFTKHYTQLAEASKRGEGALREAWKATPDAIRSFISNEMAGEWDQLKADAKSAVVAA